MGHASAFNGSQVIHPLSERKDVVPSKTESEKLPTSTIGSAEGGSDYEDYGDYGWKASADETSLFGVEKNEENTFFDDKCIYVSTLLLWDRDYDFENITQEEILDKVTKALDKEYVLKIFSPLKLFNHSPNFGNVLFLPVPPPRKMWT